MLKQLALKEAATMSPLDRAKVSLMRKARVVQRVLQSPDGQELISMLEREFLYGEMIDPSPYRTHYNLGQRDVVAYLRQLSNYGENANGSREPEPKP